MNPMTKLMCFGGVATLLVACGPKTEEIDDPAMEATAANIGQESGELGELPAEASESEVQSQVQAVGGSIQGLVGQHQAYAATTGLTAPSADAGLSEQDGGDPVSWDGTTLNVDWSTGTDGFDYVYKVNLTFGDAADGGRTIDGTYEFKYDISGSKYEINAKYLGVTTDSSGCAVGGSFEMDYKIGFDAGGLAGVPGLDAANQDGAVVITYNACDDVVVAGS